MEGQLDITEAGGTCFWLMATYYCVDNNDSDITEKFSISDLDHSHVPDATSTGGQGTAATTEHTGNESGVVEVEEKKMPLSVQDRMQNIRNRLLLKTGISSTASRPATENPVSDTEARVPPTDPLPTLADDYDALLLATNKGSDNPQPPLSPSLPPQVPSDVTVESVTVVVAAPDAVVMREGIMSTIGSNDGDDDMDCPGSVSSASESTDGISPQDGLAVSAGTLSTSQTAEDDEVDGEEHGSEQSSADDVIPCSVGSSDDTPSPVLNDGNVAALQSGESVGVAATSVDSTLHDGNEPARNITAPVSAQTTVPPRTALPLKSSAPCKPVLMSLLEAQDSNDLNESFSSPIRDSSSLTKEMILARRLPAATSPRSALGSAAGPSTYPVVQPIAAISPREEATDDRSSTVTAIGGTVTSDMALDDINAQNIFSRMGNLKQRMMKVGAPLPSSHAPGESSTAATVVSNVSDVSDLPDVESTEGTQVSAMDRIRSRLLASKLK